VIGEVVAEVTVHNTAEFVLRLSESEARELAGSLGEIYMDLDGRLPENVVRVWQTLNSKIVDFDTRYIDGGN
jgi:hypothetical protein